MYEKVIFYFRMTQIMLTILGYILRMFNMEWEISIAEMQIIRMCDQSVGHAKMTQHWFLQLSPSLSLSLERNYSKQLYLSTCF